MTGLKCFYCLVAYETNTQQDLRYAEFVYSGKSMCRQHVNEWRGLDRDFDRYPAIEADE